MIEVMFNELNENTDFIYDSVIKERINMNCFSIMLEEGKYGEVKKVS